MKKILLSIFTSFILVSCSKNKNLEITENFIENLNSANIEMAEQMTSDDFEVEYNYDGHKKSKINYFNEYRNKSMLNPNIKVLNYTNEGNRLLFAVENTTDFTKYLQTPKLKYNYTFFFVDSKIMKLQIDSVAGYSNSLKENSKKWSEFENWIEQNHPLLLDSVKDKPYTSSTISLLKKYSEKK